MTAPAGEESAKARRRRVKEERDAALAAALAKGLSPEEAQQEVNQVMRERAKAEAMARAAAAPPKEKKQPEPTQSTAAAGNGSGTRAPLDDLRPSLRTPEPTAPRSPTPVAAEPGPSSAILERFLSPPKAPARLGNLIYLVGFLNLLSIVVRPLRERIDEVGAYLPGAAYGFASAYAAISGLFLLLLAHSVKRRKRRGWLAALVLLSLSVISSLLVGIEYTPVATVLAALGVALLVYYRKEFRAKADQGTRWRALRVFLVLLVGSVALGTIIVWRARRIADGDSVQDGFDALGYTLFGMGGLLDHYSIGAGPHRGTGVLNSTLLGLGLLTLFVPAFLFFRSPAQSSSLDAGDDARIRGLLDAQPDSLGYFATRRDKEIVWSETGKSGIAYRVISGVMLASGDPLGDPEAWPGAIRAFLDLADSHGWTPAVLGCSELGGTIWVRETGFQALEIGDEAIVDTATFSLQGRSMRNVRQMVNRIRRAGYDTAMMRVRDTDPTVRADALRDADSWRVGGTERGFSMATSRVFDADLDPDALIIVATKDGGVEGMLQFVPWGTDGMSLDLMRRNPAADPGANELLIVDALSKAPQFGIARVSLNFAMFRSTFERGEKLGAGPVLKTWRKMLLLGNRWFQLESLYKFNAKFQPVWYPRFIIYPRVADVARVSLAMGQAEAFIVFPRVPWPGRKGRS